VTNKDKAEDIVRDFYVSSEQMGFQRLTGLQKSIERALDKAEMKGRKAGLEIYENLKPASDTL